MKYYLFIDTSSSLAMCSLMNTDLNLCSLKYLNSSFSHSEKLFKLIDTALNEQSITLKDIDTIFYIAGPGSFTGLRISYSVVLGFKRSLGLNIKGLNLLDVLLDNLKAINSLRASIIKSSQEEYFIKAIDSNNKIILNECLLNKDELISFLKANANISINGDTTSFKDLKNINILDQKNFNLTNPYSMFEMAKEKFYDEPIYLKNAYMR